MAMSESGSASVGGGGGGGGPTWDLTHSLAPYLDRHLVFPLLEFIQALAIYPDSDLLEAKISLLSQTNMVDFAMDIYKHLHSKGGGSDVVPAQMKERRLVVVTELKTLKQAASRVVEFLSDPERVKALRSSGTDRDATLAFLQTEHGIGSEDVEALYKYAKFQYECGNYSVAAEFLYFYRTIARDAEKSFKALWGKFAAEILMQNWGEAMEDLMRLKDVIDATHFPSAVEQLQQRTWLAHWSLFVFFNHENGRNAILDLFLNERYLNTIQTNARHLLRYLAAAALCNRRRRALIPAVVNAVAQETADALAASGEEESTKQDPICAFLEALYVRHDLEEAQATLAACDAVLASDFFLVGLRQEFAENSRMYIFESYCRVHKTIDLSEFAGTLGMGVDEAERWILEMIRSDRISARLDAERGVVVMASPYLTPMDRIVERVKGLHQRTEAIAAAVHSRGYAVA